MRHLCRFSIALSEFDIVCDVCFPVQKDLLRYLRRKNHAISFRQPRSQENYTKKYQYLLCVPLSNSEKQCDFELQPKAQKYIPENLPCHK